ncbi:MAG TPA: hypothetical protein VMZ26_11490, partial [Pyrinomonadaceae bacterium]|nr:hypothetical protein [Pyrinomonadaceae bacterium]
PGLEVLYADDRLDAIAVWKSGPDFRLLTADKIRRAEIDAELETFSDSLEEADEESPVAEYGEDSRVSKERRRREYENFTWNSFAGGSIGAPTTQPTQAEFVPARDGLDAAPSAERWKTRAGAVEIRADEKGLYKVVAGRLTKIKNGYYVDPVITPNGRWVVATRYDTEQGAQLVRVSLLTNKHFVVQSEELPAYRAMAFIPSIGRMLVGPFEDEGGEYDVDGPETPDDGSGYSLLDPETGSLIPARGEVRPVVQQTYRPLQPSANPSEFWAAIPMETETIVGLYNIRTFSIKPILKLPKIRFDSMNTWVDESDGRIYFVYEGQLLAAPIKTK